MSFFKSIVVADHKGKLDKFVCQVLGQDKWAISFSDNLHDLEEAVRSTQHHLIIVNADIPGFDPFKFMARLTHLFGEERPRVLLCVSSNVSRTLRHGNKAGIDDFLTVPFHGAELASKAKRQLQYFNSSDQLHAEIERLKTMVLNEKSHSRKTFEQLEKERQLKEKYKQQIVAKQKKERKQERRHVTPPAPKPDNIVPISPKRHELSFPVLQAPEEKKRESRAKPLTPPLPAVARRKRGDRKKDLRENKSPLTAKKVTQTDTQTFVNAKAVVLAVKVKGLMNLIDELDSETALQLSEQVVTNIRETIEAHQGQVVQVYRNTIIALFRKRKECLIPAQHAGIAAIELEKESMFFSEKSPLLEGVFLSSAIHAGRVSLMNFDSEIGSFSFSKTIEEVCEIVDCIPKSKIYISEVAFSENEHLLTLKSEMVHHLLCSNQSISVAELKGAKNFDSNTVQQNEIGPAGEELIFLHSRAKLA